MQCSLVLSCHENDPEATGWPWRVPGIPGPQQPPAKRTQPQYPVPMNIPLLAPSHTRPRQGPAPYRHGRSGSNQECGDGQPPVVSPGNASGYPVTQLPSPAGLIWVRIWRGFRRAGNDVAQLALAPPRAALRVAPPSSGLMPPNI